MLTLYKLRHDNDCLTYLKSKGLISSVEKSRWSKAEKKFLVQHLDCKCAFYTRGKNDYGVQFEQHALKVYSKAAAEQKLKELNRQGAIVNDGVTIQDAIDGWIEERKLLGRSEHTQYVYRQTANLLRDACHAASPKVTRIADVTGLHVQKMRAEWMGGKDKKKVARNSQRNRMGWLFGFFHYCQRMGWVKENLIALAPKLDAPKVRANFASLHHEDREEQTMPLDLDGTDTNYRKILAAVHPYLSGLIGRRRYHAEDSRKKKMTNPLLARPDHVYALLEVMYHTGLRISDALHFDVNALIDDGDCAVYNTIQIKTGHEVTCYLPLWLAKKLRRLERISPRYIFFDGRESYTSFLESGLQPTLPLIGEAAGVAGVRCHRFRDSFAVNRLNEGLLLEDVQKLLGHRSLRTTERYYAPFVKSRQDRLRGIVVGKWGAPEPPPSNLIVLPKRKKRAS